REAVRAADEDRGGGRQRATAVVLPAVGDAGLEVRVADQVVPVGRRDDDVVHVQVRLCGRGAGAVLVDVEDGVLHDAGRGRVRLAVGPLRREVDRTGDLRPDPRRDRELIEA